MNFKERKFSEKAKANPLLGLCSMYPAAGIIEGMCMGWDFVWIDGQHGQYGYDSIAHALRAAQAIDLDTMIRTPGQEPGVLGQIADLAPSAVMVPMINTADEAIQCVRALRFPPLGSRSYGGRRVIDLLGREYYSQSELFVIAQIETRIAVENAAQIAATPGIDCLFFGADDMKVQMGLPINTPIFESKPLRNAMQQMATAAIAAGKLCGTVAPTASALRAGIQMGYRVFIGGADIMFLRTAASDKLTELRSEISGSSRTERPNAVSSPDVPLYGR